jgi:RNA 2',3'-cyclic 3'-phosphodiesterase
MVSHRGGLKSLAASPESNIMSDRCFVAVDIDDPLLKVALQRAQATLVATGADVKAVEEENIHITLKFLSEIPEARTAQVAELVRGITFKPFTLYFRGVGVFPAPSKPSVVWAGVQGNASEMLAVFTELERGLKALGFEPEMRQFQPHVTLCRVRSGRNRAQLAEAVKMMQDKEFGILMVKHITLMKSVLTRSGPIYSTVAESRALK